MHEVQDRTWAVDRYERPATLDEALALLDRHEANARIISGGTDLLLELQRKVRSLEVLIDLSAIPHLNEITQVNGRISLGPLVTHKDIVSSELIVNAGLPLAQASLEVGSAQLRNRATVVGNVVTASPANDTISALLALDATVHLASARGERSIAMRDFYLGVRHTVMESNELVTSISFRELAAADRGIFAKIGLRSAQAISVVHGAAVISETDGVVTKARIALGSVAPVVILVDAAQMLVDSPLTVDRIKGCAAAAAAEVTPISDGRATAEYRSSIVEVAVARMLTSLLDATERSLWPKRVTTLDNAQAAPLTTPVSVGENDRMQMTVNGVSVQGPAHCDTTLLDWVRENATGHDGAALTGTKEGCAEGECGACTVHMDGKAVLACLVAAPQASGVNIITIEGLATDRDVAIQDAFVDLGAVQCGYCTPGFVMAASSLVSEHEQLTPHEIRDGFSGNICRCTGYESLVESLVRIAEGGR